LLKKHLLSPARSSIPWKRGGAEAAGTPDARVWMRPWNQWTDFWLKISPGLSE